jgi:hypothetical protein
MEMQQASNNQNPTKKGKKNLTPDFKTFNK